MGPMWSAIFSVSCYFLCLRWTQALCQLDKAKRAADTLSGDSEPTDHQGNLLSSLLKALSDKDGWEEPSPRSRPDSRYLRYMKRIYRMSATHEGVPKLRVRHLYNTVRLFAPREECPKKSSGLSSQDLSYRLDRVTAEEHLLKSVLLYSFDKVFVPPVSLVCYLHIKGQESPDKQVCFSVQQSVIHVQIEQRNRRKWIEVDITSFLQPMLASYMKNIHIVVNFTCIKDGSQQVDEQTVGQVLKPPPLLLYLNDTSEQAYRRWTLNEKTLSSEKQRSALDLVNLHSSLSLALKKRSLPLGRNVASEKPLSHQSPAKALSLAEHYRNFEFPTDECELQNFRVSFRQLNWDHWIIAPHRYNPRYCKGVCPRAIGHRYGSPVHTMVQNIIYEKLDSSVPRPSCVPSEYSPLSVLTIENDGSIAYKEYQDMIATKCTCR
ncbi:growth/differentiation factor 9 [Erpetoichthys calabaricus]|uniref:Growth/differentiation factor 9 n=1 Tax=Erpetoichthys calabaricus TaxID=27687 RepID=A0A8C4S3N5_ERPCA|nr:growth/differentiation factor 9 [Erpetoichthys calabaricus]